MQSKQCRELCTTTLRFDTLLTPSMRPVLISGPLVSRAIAIDLDSENPAAALRTFSMVPLWYWEQLQTQTNSNQNNLVLSVSCLFLS